MGITEGAEKRTENIFKAIMEENLGREMDIKIYKAQRTPNRLNLKKDTLRHMIMKLSKIKKNFESSKEKQHIIYKGTFIRI